MTNSDQDVLLHEEYRALRTEMLIRITIQNVTVLGAVAVFITATSLMVIAPDQTGRLSFLQALATLALALQWCHHGVRQCALKKAILERDEQAGRANGWESWLPGQRPPSLLGSRWFVSTKAVFIGLTAASIGLAMPDHGVTLWGAIAALIAMTAALLSNPRE